MSSISLPFVFIWVIALGIAGSLGNVSADFGSGQDVYTKIRNNHNPLVPPAHQNLTINLGLELRRLIELDEKAQVLSAQVNLIVTWRDPSLAWNQKLLPHTNSVQLPAHRVWTPSIKLWNSVVEEDAFDGKSMKKVGSLYISPNGQVYWSIVALTKTACTVDVTYYPFDQQTCILKFGPHDAQIVLGLYNDRNYARLNHYYRSVTWSIIETPAYLNVYKMPEGVPTETDMTFYLTIRRKALWVWLSQVNPLLAMAFLTLLPCALGRSRVLEKLILHVVCLLGLFFIHLWTVSKIPPTSLVTPHILTYLNSLTLLNLIHVTLTCLLSSSASQSNSSNCFSCLSQWIPKNVVNTIGKFFCVNLLNKSQKKKIMDDKQNVEENNESIPSQSSSEPHETSSSAADTLAKIFDRAIFISMAVGVVVETLSFLLTPPHQFEEVSDRQIVALYTP